MKKFDNFGDVFRYVQHVIDSSKPTFLGTISEQLYKDSNEFTYRESGDMYKSGELHSNFKEGIIVERTPYVRRRYYEGGKAGAGNKKAQPRWFDKTVAKYKTRYLDMLAKELISAKKEV